ncbi:uncharacterized protein MONOS_14006 [Monocercomonoides exilis]|uniref:uncharacterized protein n=1 Tax=Monocercomonoides exilis TaxID=2049356 RepID=UPI0035599B89|nr:hypothetical protein MONOS_14006 [Monocercomonoides exilis]|eukprot:MONOS_14006.1-p1 / transcript=MONOS_14006.1 / gene=MONOS_14006 / organism=Monocercomonoides_exilis_PA203 / gene_product=unspecified product / transcript_product=unspecified product / location=Mono_scaffold00920:4331-5448(+) / protein_length=242 / sequence_SO=supercontig / SO=protein_coding / is_pseudo=false
MNEITSSLSSSLSSSSSSLSSSSSSLSSTSAAASFSASASSSENKQRVSSAAVVLRDGRWGTLTSNNILSIIRCGGSDQAHQQQQQQQQQQKRSQPIVVDVPLNWPIFSCRAHFPAAAVSATREVRVNVMITSHVSIPLEFETVTLLFNHSSLSTTLTNEQLNWTSLMDSYQLRSPHKLSSLSSETTASSKSSSKASKASSSKSSSESASSSPSPSSIISQTDSLLPPPDVPAPPHLIFEK